MYTVTVKIEAAGFFFAEVFNFASFYDAVMFAKEAIKRNVVASATVSHTDFHVITSDDAVKKLDAIIAVVV